MIDGDKIQVGEQALTLPALNIKLFKKFKEDLGKLMSVESVKGMTQQDYVAAAMPVILANLQRNHPDLTMDDLEDGLSFADVPKVITLMFKVSGFAADKAAGDDPKLQPGSKT